MENKKLQICIIGRNIKNSKWNLLYEVLEDNKDDIEYSLYDVVDSKWESKYKENDLSYDAFIYLATMPKFQDKPYAHLKASANEDDIYGAISELFSKFDSTENSSEDDKIVSEIPAGCNNDNVDANDSTVSDNIYCSNISNNPVSISTDNGCNSNVSSNSLVGITINVNGKEVVLHKDDAYKLKELMEFVKEFGYTITDVIVE